ncbi:hypothetical protein KFE25_003432 [Diacronema lutheri]|mgnify:CR=1 FL=1|uniref:Dioxygenase n=1 Tax=Diacronema lutheri TaxID=2081491 RepID=A0A8J5XI00_DIALT|nr:hypothetical protein KFE25_003432 [Diacronema lutheri]
MPSLVLALSSGLVRPGPPPARVAARIAEAPWRRAYEPASEWDRTPCAVLGDAPLPPELRGVLYRNGAGRIRVGTQLYSHWFDGDGFVTRLELDGSRTALSSGRFVRTPRFLAQGDTTDTMMVRGAWTPRGDGGVLANCLRLPSNPANTNVARLPPDGRLYALCEGGRPLELDPLTLETTGGEYDARGALRSPLPGLPPTTFGAHMRVDPTDGTIYNFGLDYGLSLKLKLLRISPDGAVSSRDFGLQSMPLYHDLSISGNFLILTRTPYEISTARVLGALVGSGGSMFAWNADAQSHVDVYDKRTLQQVASIASPPFSCYHHVNAFEDPERAGRTVLRIEAHNTDRLAVERQMSCMYDAWFTVENECSLLELELDVPAATLVRSARLDGDGAARPAELPCINPRFVGRPHRWVYRNALGATCGCLQDVEKVDLRARGRPADRWSPGDGRYAGESVFVPRTPGAVSAPCAPDEEDEGWLLLYVYDSAAHASEVVVLDARDLGAGPRWSVRLPAHVPPSFHGCWVPHEAPRS